MLDQRTRDLADRASSDLESLRAENLQLHGRIDESHKKSSAAIEEVSKRLVNHAVGGLRISAWSVTLILVGTVLLVVAPFVDETAGITCRVLSHLVEQDFVRDLGHRTRSDYLSQSYLVGAEGLEPPTCSL